MNKKEIIKTLIITTLIYIIGIIVGFVFNTHKPEISTMKVEALKDGGLRTVGIITIKSGPEVSILGYKKKLLTGHIEYTYETKKSSVSSEEIIKEYANHKVHWQINYFSVILGFLIVFITVFIIKFIFFDKSKKKRCFES